MHEIDAAHHFQCFAADVTGAAIAGGGEGERAGFRLRLGDQLLQRVGFDRRIDDDDVGRRGNVDDRREIFLRRILRRGIDPLIDRQHAGGGEQQRIAIGRRIGDARRAK